MHDCSKTKEELIDLVFNELAAESELGLLEEMEACRDCRAEYHFMRQALSAFDEALPAMLPAGEFWIGHHARLEERLEAAAGGVASSGPAPLWRRALGASFSIPFPAAVAAALLLAVTSVLAIRSFIFSPRMERPREAAATAEKIRYVEVPVEKRVVEERVVTRTVYVNRRTQGAARTVPSAGDLPGMTAQNKDQKDNAASAALNGFQPPSDVKLTVIKGIQNYEK